MVGARRWAFGLSSLRSSVRIIYSVPLPAQPTKKGRLFLAKATFFLMTGRGEKIRTSGLCLPKAALYQAELHPERAQ